MPNTFVKRDGRQEPFTEQKLQAAIRAAYQAAEEGLGDDHLRALTARVLKRLGDKETVTAEQMNHAVQAILARECQSAADEYRHTRQERDEARERGGKLRKTIDHIVRETDRENANVGQGPSSKLLQMAETISRDYAEKTLTSKDVLAAMHDNILYPHDYSWNSLGTTTCIQIPLGKLLASGFNTGHGFIRSPQSIKTAALLSAIIVQADQNDQHGGQSYGFYDRDLAPYVAREFARQLRRLREDLTKLGVDPGTVSAPQLEARAWEKTESETFQAMEAMVHNANTMHSRAGAQVPFWSINFGTDTSREGRIVTKALLLAYEKGLGKGEQPIFPNLIFKVKKGVNAEEGDPNYDLYQLSMRVSAKRLFPNYVFQDASFNKDFPEDVPAMGCRTRIAWNVNKPADEQTCDGRGNISFTTLNLPGLALRAAKGEGEEADLTALSAEYDLHLLPQHAADATIRRFFGLLDRYTDLGIRQLHERFQYQITFKKADFPFLLGAGVYMDADRLGEEDSLEDVWKHGTLSLGFIGLAETLVALLGQHHAEDAAADHLGEQIVRFMRQKLDEATRRLSLNYSLLATPAEGLSGKFVKRDKDFFGTVQGVTDKPWYTNSFHVPVEKAISVFDKIRIEGKYHKYCNAGAISYIELAESPENNPEAMQDILRFMQEQDMGYVAVNFPVDRCTDCDYQGVIEEPACPSCASEHISRIRRITGYLAELKMFNEAKKAETVNRKRHTFQH